MKEERQRGRATGRGWKVEGDPQGVWLQERLSVHSCKFKGEEKTREGKKNSPDSKFTAANEERDGGGAKGSVLAAALTLGAEDVV